MSAKYIFRLDDISENMNWDNFFCLEKIFDKYRIKPVIGVIPKNEDEELLKYPKCEFDFWEKIRELQNKKGWSVALHGYNHKYLTNDAGILNINNRSEFAGVPYKIQNKKIATGKEIFKKNKITIDAFMAPAHSFDHNTLKALENNDIGIITDGYTLYPYYYRNILFVPQLFSTPRKMLFGVFTWCLHPNVMKSKGIKRVERFIEENKENIISFSDSKKYVTNSYLNKAVGDLNKIVLNKLRSNR